MLSQRVTRYYLQDQWDQVLWANPRDYQVDFYLDLTYSLYNDYFLDVEEEHCILKTNLYHIKLYHNCGLSL